MGDSPFSSLGLEFEMLRGAREGGRFAWERAAETEAAGAMMFTFRDLGFLPADLWGGRGLVEGFQDE